MQITLSKLRARVEADPRRQWVIAAACGINPTTMSFYIRGHRAYTQEHLLALCKEFECDPEDITGVYVFDLDP